VSNEPGWATPAIRRSEGIIAGYLAGSLPGNRITGSSARWAAARTPAATGYAGSQLHRSPAAQRRDVQRGTLLVPIPAADSGCEARAGLCYGSKAYAMLRVAPRVTGEPGGGRARTHRRNRLRGCSMS